MGNYKFKLSDMMPNAWFYKLRDMSKTKNSSTYLVRKKLPYYTQRPSLSQPRFCTSLNTHFMEPPRKSSRRKSIYEPSPKHVSAGTVPARITSSPTDIIIDLNRKSSFEVELAPILTKPIKTNKVIDVKPETEHLKKRRPRGIKLRGNNSPRIARMNTNHGSSSSSGTGTGRKKSFSESFAIVKSSFDPQRDFKDSMVEMILENNLRESKDLVELLALYLSLNSDGYHDIIVKAFEQIWFDMADLRL